MEIRAASVNQVLRAQNGTWYEIDGDVGGVVNDLKRIDAGFRVRVPEREDPPIFVLLHEYHDGCPHNGTGGPGSSYLVKTVQAERTMSGTWGGLDQRIVKEIMRVGHSSYDYAAELDRANRQARENARKGRMEQMGEAGERVAHAIRKDTGARYRGRTFVPRDVKEA